MYYNNDVYCDRFTFSLQSSEFAFEVADDDEDDFNTSCCEADDRQFATVIERIDEALLL